MSRKQIELMFSGFMLLLGIGFMYHTFDPEYQQMGIGAQVGPIFYPRILLVVWLLLSVGMLIEAAVKNGGERQGHQLEKRPADASCSSACA